MATLPLPFDDIAPDLSSVLQRVACYPRLRYMGSKYRAMPQLLEIFSTLQFNTVLDAFSGSGVVAYALKALGKQVIANDFLNFPATVAKATVENPGTHLSAEQITRLLQPNQDGRDFIKRTFGGLYFPDDDLAFLDAAWSHVESLAPYQQAIAISALCLAAARKQPRGVFTIVDVRYDDGRRYMRMSLQDLFIESVQSYNAATFDNGLQNLAICHDVFSLGPTGLHLVYLDPPYAPPRDDNDYIKRYHFLEGLSLYWHGQTILENTMTKKLAKRFMPFAYKRTIRQALPDLISHFSESVIVMSYSSNSVPDKEEVIEILKRHGKDVQVHEFPHVYSFGTHATAVRREVLEYVFVAT